MIRISNQILWLLFHMSFMLLYIVDRLPNEIIHSDKISQMIKIVGLMIMIIVLLGALVDATNGIVNMLKWLFKLCKKAAGKIG